MARKWRPGSFGEMTGQEHVVRTIENAIRADRIHHAFLFTGTRGVGKTTSARIFAKILNCANRDGINPCGTCSSCKEITGGNSIDVLEIDGASNNSVDNVRSIIEQVAYAPMHGTYRIVIIDEVHMLSTSAFNALLKTLEEPPAHAKFIFATTESHKVPQTILSRVQRFDFKRISSYHIQERLAFICEQEGIRFDNEALRIIADKGDGSMRDALTVFDQVHAFCDGELNAEAVRTVLGIPAETFFFDILEAIKEHDIGTALSTVEVFLAQGAEIDSFIEGLLKTLRDALCVKASKLTPAQLGLSEESYRQLRDICQPLGQGDLLRLARIASETIREMRDAPHPRIALEVGLSRMTWIDRVDSIRNLLKLQADGNLAISQEKKNPS